MKDRLVNGIIAGILAGIGMNIINYPAYLLNLSTIRYLDWAGILIFGRRPVAIWEAVFAQLVQIAFSAFVGVVFAYLIPTVSSRYYIVKGIFFGIISWFFIYAAGIALRLPFLTLIPFRTSLINFISSIVFGLVLAESLRRLDKNPVHKS